MNQTRQPPDKVYNTPRPAFLRPDDPTQDVNLPRGLEFPLRATITVAELEEMYGITLGVSPSLTLADALTQLIDMPPTEGEVVRCRQVALRIRSVASGGVIEQVGLIIDQDHV